jgi:nitrous oxidase accessory protein
MQGKRIEIEHMNQTLEKISTLAILVIVVGFSLSLTNSVLANFTPLPPVPTPIYLKSDGVVDPVTAPLARVGDTYTLTGTINNTIEVQRSNIIIRGNGFNITKPSVETEALMMPVGWLPGVRVVGIDNVTITDIVFESCNTGVTVENSTGITISQNTIANANSGIVVLSSSDINIINNNMNLPNRSFATGINFLPSNPNTNNPTDIMINGNQIVGTSSEVPNSPPQPQQYGIWGGFDDSQMIENNISQIKGIGLYYTGSNNLISRNNFQDNYEGILFTGSSEISVNNTVYDNNFNHNSNNVVVPFIRNPAPNHWDNGTVGNYWSDYNGTDANSDGIGDTPYLIETIYYDYEAGKNVTVLEGKDNFPLMDPTNIAIAISGNTPPPNTSPPSSASPSPSQTPPATASSAPIPSTSPAVPEFSTEMVPFALLLISSLAVAIRRLRHR